MRKSDWYTVAALAMGLAAGLAVWLYVGTGWGAVIIGVMMAALANHGLKQQAANETIINKGNSP